MKKAEKMILVRRSLGSYDLMKQIICISPSHIVSTTSSILQCESIHTSEIKNTRSNKFNKTKLRIENNIDIKENHIYFAQAKFTAILIPNKHYPYQIQHRSNDVKKLYTS